VLADFSCTATAARREAQRVMAEVVRFVEVTLKLPADPGKSRVAPLPDCTFLGCQISRKQLCWCDAAVEAFRTEVRRLTGRS